MKRPNIAVLLARLPLATVLAMTLLMSALAYVACGEKKDNDSEDALALILAASGNGPFPVTDGNVFSIQYRNSTNVTITVWLVGNQPPCSQAVAALGHCNTAGWLPADYETHWNTLRTNGYFSDSGTHFYTITKRGVSTEINISNHIELQPGETLRIVPPISGGKPEWYWNAGGATTAGTNAWITRTKTNGGWC